MDEIDEFDLHDACCLFCQAPTEHGLPCGTDAVLHDACGMTWCQEHEYRGDLITWGKAHGWPPLSHPPLYDVAQGEGAWMLAIGFGSEDMVFMLLAAIEAMEIVV